jgi:uncharacterized membrane protein
MKRSNSAARWRLSAFWAPLLSAVSLAAQPATFSVQPLETIPGGSVAIVNDVNEAGEAVGSAGEGTSACPENCAVIWNDGAPTLLTAEGATDTYAVAINNAGQVVGDGFTPNATGGEDYTAIIWNNGTASLLPGPAPQYPETYAYSINDAGKVVGVAVSSSDGDGEATEWNGLTPTVLGTARRCTGADTGSTATAVNSDGTVVGYLIVIDDQCPKDVATVWQGTTPTLLGGGVLYAINNAGLIVGEGAHGATAWVNGVATPLQRLSGASNNANSSATAVNNRGIIVGTTQVSKETPPGKTTYHALLWSSVSAAPQDLNDLISAAAAKKYVLTEATGINGSCTIVVNGFSRKDTINNIAFLLKPTNPSSCANGLLEH